MAWLPAIATIGSALINSFGQSDTNDTNMQIQNNNSAFNAEQATLNRSFNADQANINREFQSREASWNREFQHNEAASIWQRGVKDMQAAGLNPMLAYSQGGNPSPSGSMASGSQASGTATTHGAPGNMQNVFANAGNSASQWAGLERTMAETDNIKAETENKRAELAGKQGSGQLNDAQVANLRAQTTAHLAQADLTSMQREKVKEEIGQVIANTENLDQDTLLKRVNTILQRHDVARMSAEEAYFKSPVGRESPHNKYGPQNPFRLIEGLGERVINRWGSKSLPSPADHSTSKSPIPYR